MTKYIFLLCVFFSTSLSSQSLDSAKLENLLCFFQPKETVLDLTFRSNDKDSLVVRIDFEQILTPRERAKHMLVMKDGEARFVDTFLLEMPVLMRIYIDEDDGRLFLPPGFHANVNYALDHDHLKSTFDSDLLAKINAYYDEKASLHGNNDIRLFYNAHLRKESLQEVHDTFADLKQRMLKLKSKYDDLPLWWRNYEDNNINQTHAGYHAGASRYRKFMLEIDEKDTTEISPPFNLDSLDPEHLSSIFSLGILDDYIRGDVTIEEMRKKNRAEQVKEAFLWRKEITDSLWHDVYCARLYMRMLASPGYYSDSLFASILSVMSQEAQAFIKLQKKDFEDLDGKTAPNFHLKNLVDSLVDLKEFREKVVLLDFWFVGCKGCVMEWPYDSMLVEKLAQEDFALVKICMLSGKEACTRTIKKQDLAGYHLISNGAWDDKLRSRYQIQGYPRYVLIDRKGIVIDGWCERPSESTLIPKILAALSK